LDATPPTPPRICRRFVLKQGRKRGQVMVLGCVTMLLLALSLMMSFSVANAVHERIRIQSHADAMAFSMAVVEARTMNYLAYSNRAIAAAFVSMTSAHVYEAILSSSVNLMKGMRMAAIVATALELIICIASFGTSDCCRHAKDLAKIVKKYGEAIQKYESLVQNLENQFNDTVASFVKLADDIHTSQRNIVNTTSQVLREGNGLDRMREINAPCASNTRDDIRRVGNLNVGEFACAMEGSPLDNAAPTHKKPESDQACPTPSGESNRRQIMSNVVNAARPDFLSSSHGIFMRLSPLEGLISLGTGDFLGKLQENLETMQEVFDGLGDIFGGLEGVFGNDLPELKKLMEEAKGLAGIAGNANQALNQIVQAIQEGISKISNWLSLSFTPDDVFNSSFLDELLKDIPDPMFLIGVGPYQVDGRFTDNYCDKASLTSEGKLSCAKTSGTFFIYLYRDMPGFGWAKAAGIASSDKHEVGGGHTGNHDKYKGLLTNSACTNGGNCFTNYRLDSAENQWGQPVVYSFITQPLEAWTRSGNQCSQTRQAWELNDAGTVNIQDGGRETGRLMLRADRPGTAVSKALVYFHRMDDWAFPPNLFDPYWRAKLHPFADPPSGGDTGEMERVLDSAGYVKPGSGG